MTTTTTEPRRVRTRDRSGTEGVVFDEDPDGWIYWVGTDGACHVSRADYLETIT